MNLAQVVREVIQESATEIEGRDVRWHVAPLPVVTGDRAMLRVVMSNLISNALKFSRARHPAEITIGCETTKEQEIVVFVRDNGAGFDMRHVDKLFGVFQRLHPQQEFPGTGVGLATVRRVVDRHHGETWARSEVGQGATFFFSLPRTEGTGSSDDPELRHRFVR